MRISEAPPPEVVVLPEEDLPLPPPLKPPEGDVPLVPTPPAYKYKVVELFKVIVP